MKQRAGVYRVLSSQDARSTATCNWPGGPAENRQSVVWLGTQQMKTLCLQQLSLSQSPGESPAGWGLCGERPEVDMGSKAAHLSRIIPVAGQGQGPLPSGEFTCAVSLLLQVLVLSNPPNHLWAQRSDFENGLQRCNCW